MMWTISNILSLLRVPLAFVMLVTDPCIRILAIVSAMVTDGLDGFLARRYRRTSQFGAFLDPLTDKFFVLFVLLIFLSEGRLATWELLSLLSRDFAVVIFGLYLVFSGTLARYQLKAIWSGKVTTFLQFGILIALTMGIDVPAFWYTCFIALGCLALLELCLIRDHQRH